ncbi:transglycosylase SLT domain-containing protein [Shigella flexneri]
MNETVRWHALKRNPGHGDDFDYVDTRTFLRAVDAVLPELKPLFEKYAEEIDWRLLAAIAYQESHWDHRPLHRRVCADDDVNADTAQSLGITDRTDAEQSISGGVRYLQEMTSKAPESVPENERIRFALAAYNMGYAPVLDARALTAKTKGNPDSWADVNSVCLYLARNPITAS